MSSFMDGFKLSLGYRPTTNLYRLLVTTNYSGSNQWFTTRTEDIYEDTLKKWGHVEDTLNAKRCWNKIRYLNTNCDLEIPLHKKKDKCNSTDER